MNVYGHFGDHPPHVCRPERGSGVLGAGSGVIITLPSAVQMTAAGDELRPVGRVSPSSGGSAASRDCWDQQSAGHVILTYTRNRWRKYLTGSQTLTKTV